jgi:hypothetical protein
MLGPAGGMTSATETAKDNIFKLLEKALDIISGSVKLLNRLVYYASKYVLK